MNSENYNRGDAEDGEIICLAKAQKRENKFSQRKEGAKRNDLQNPNPASADMTEVGRSFLYLKISS